MDTELRARVHEVTKRLEECLPATGWFVAGSLPELCEEVADMIEELTQSVASSIPIAPTGPDSIAGVLAEIHREMSGARSVSIRADSRNMLMEVDGCPNLAKCSGGVMRICVPDLVVAAVAQRILETPVGLSVSRRHDTCRHEYKPAWLSQLLAELAEFGAEGMVVLRGESVIFSHLPTDDHAKALSESVMINEESATGRLPDVGVRCHNRKVLMMRLGRVFVSVSLRPKGADEIEIRERIERAVISPPWAK